MLLDLGTYVVKEPSILYVQLPAHKRDALRYSFSNTAHEMKPRNGFYYPCSGRKVVGGELRIIEEYFQVWRNFLVGTNLMCTTCCLHRGDLILI